MVHPKLVYVVAKEFSEYSPSTTAPMTWWILPCKALSVLANLAVAALNPVETAGLRAAVLEARRADFWMALQEIVSAQLINWDQSESMKSSMGRYIPPEHLERWRRAMEMGVEIRKVVMRLRNWLEVFRQHRKKEPMGKGASESRESEKSRYLMSSTAKKSSNIKNIYLMQRFMIRQITQRHIYTLHAVRTYR